MILLIGVPVVLATYKLVWLDYSLDDVLPSKRYHVTLSMTLDGHGDKAGIRVFLPVTDERQQIANEHREDGRFRFREEVAGLNRLGSWTAATASDGETIAYAFDFRARALQYDIGDELEVPDRYPESIAAYLRPTDTVQVDAGEIAAELHTIGADEGALLDRIRRIHERVRGLESRPFKGTTDALTALRLGEASCNGKSRLFLAMARATGIPGRLVGGLILTSGSKRTSHQWLELYVSGHWIPFDPTNDHFASLPARYLVLYRGDKVLFHHTSDINFQYRFVTRSTIAPSRATLTSLGSFNVWGLFDRLGLPFSLLRTVLMLPIGALIVVLFRNVVGMPTFGTFLPALIAAAAGETGLAWGMVGLLIVIACVALTRWGLHRLQLLHSPTLAILLAVVVVAMLATSMLGERLGVVELTRMSFFPIAVLAIAAERFYLSLAESEPASALKNLAGTLVVVTGCYLVMNSLALQVLVSGFPESLFLVVAANIYLGRWIGVRLLEYVRFSRFLAAS